MPLLSELTSVLFYECRISYCEEWDMSQRAFTSYKLVPCTAKKLKKPLAFPLASSNRNKVMSLS